MIRKLAIAVALALASGCSAPGRIDPDGISGLVRPACDRHDAYVQADKTLTPEQRESYLTTTKILRGIVDTALKAKHGDIAPVASR